MTLTDAGPLIALIDAGEPDHQRCTEALAQLALPLLTTWPAFTEAMCVLGRVGGWPGQQALCDSCSARTSSSPEASLASNRRAAYLMERYADRRWTSPDATLVVLAEERQISRIFTLDSDFHIYRINGRKRFDLIPA